MTLRDRIAVPPIVRHLVAAVMMPRSLVVVLAISGLVSLAITLSVLRVDFITGNGWFWDNPVGDSVTYQVGQYAYVNDVWRFPPFLTKTLNYPDGVSAAFTDFVPLAALFAKILTKLVGHPVNHLGYWVALCFVMQGVAFTWLLATLGVRSALTSVVAAVVALSLPSFLHRFGHFPLLGHFLVTGALAAYFQSTRAEHTPPWRLLSAFAFLAGWAIFINAYLWAMTAAILLATLAASALKHGRYLRHAAVGSLFLAMALAAFLLLGLSAGGHVGGLGKFSMNLLAPLSRKGVDATGGQYEGYNYLGAGVLLLVAVAAIWCRPVLAASIRKHRVLLVVLLGLLVFSLSNRVYLGQELVATYSYLGLHGKLAQLRATGRFFWVLVYVIAAVGIVVTVRRFRPEWAVALLVSAGIFQWFDAAEFRDRIRAKIGPPSQEVQVAIANLRLDHDAALMSILGFHKEVRIHPPFGCGSRLLEWDLELQRMAVLAGKPVNSVYSARPVTDCQRDTKELLAIDWKRGDALHVFMADRFPLSALKQSYPDAVALCRAKSGVVVCSPHWSAVNGADWLDASGAFSYRASVPIDFTCRGNGWRYVGEGWGPGDTAGLPMMGSFGTIVLKVGPEGVRDSILIAQVRSVGITAVRLAMNGRHLADWTLQTNRKESTAQIAFVHRVAVRANELNEIRFDVPSALRLPTRNDEPEAQFQLVALQLVPMEGAAIGTQRPSDQPVARNELTAGFGCPGRLNWMRTF